MSNNNPNRVQAGLTQGGQFTTGPRAEPDVSLVDRTPVGDMFMPDPHVYPNTYIERDEDSATAIFVDYSHFHTSSGRLEPHLLDDDGDGNAWLTGTAQRRLAHRLSDITGLAVDTDEGYGGDDPHVAFSVRLDGVGHLSDDDLTDKAHPFLAEALNTTDPGTFGSPYLYSGLDRWTEQEAQEFTAKYAQANRFYAKVTVPLDPDFAEGAQVHRSLVADDGSLMVENFDDLDNELAPDTAERMRTDLARFLVDNGHLVDQARGVNPGYDGEQLVADFWLTRNDSGTGFDDRDLGPCGAELARAARDLGPLELEIGDDGMVHAC